MAKAEPFSFRITDDDRLDRAVLREAAKIEGLSELSRSQLQKVIERGGLAVDGKRVTRAGSRVAAGARITLLYEKASTLLEAVSMALNIIFEDERLMVIDKPAGISMHPGAGSKGGTLLNGVIGHLKLAPEKWPSGMRPGIVHRIDKETSGLVVIAKDPAAHQKLSEQFSARTIERRYTALALSTPRGNRAVRRQDSGIIDTPFGRDPKRRVKMAVLKTGGRRAVTHWTVIERMNYAVLLDLKLETGRTHQIRVHLNHISSPVIGDRTYGNFELLPQKLSAAADEFGGQALHARILGFSHPATGKPLHFTSKLPSKFEDLIDVFRRN